MQYFTKSNWLSKTLSVFIAISFLSSSVFPAGLRADILTPPAIASPVLKYLSVNSANPNNYFNFLMDRGSQDELSSVTSHMSQVNQNKGDTASSRGAAGAEATEDEMSEGVPSQLARPILSNNLTTDAKKLINYFFLGLSLPQEAFWVNLQPNQQDKLTSEALKRTDLGKILLEQDLQLKKDVARYLHPDNAVGKVFWTKLYQSIEGSPVTSHRSQANLKKLKIETNNRVWVVPDQVNIAETEDGALITKASLKVLLESEYRNRRVTSHESQVTSENPNPPVPPFAKGGSGGISNESIQSLSESLMKQIIIPEITKDVNTSSRYAPLRQIYHSLILAQWYKQKQRIGDSVERIGDSKNEKLIPNRYPLNAKTNPYAQTINSNNTIGLESAVPWSKDALYQEYLKSYKQGEYNVRAVIAGLKRMYFSGGITSLASSALNIASLGITNPRLSKNLIEEGGPSVAALLSGKGPNNKITIAGATAASPLSLAELQNDIRRITFSHSSDYLDLKFNWHASGVTFDIRNDALGLKNERHLGKLSWKILEITVPPSANPLDTLDALIQGIEKNNQLIISFLSSNKNNIYKQLKELRNKYSASSAIIEELKAMFPEYGLFKGNKFKLPTSRDELNLDMFRDYDFRSTGPVLEPGAVFLFTLVWAKMALEKADAAGITDNRKVMLARDARKIEPELIQAVEAALRYAGLDVIYVASDGPNAVTSYSWAVQEFKPLISIFVTASHVSRPKNIIVRGFKVAMLNEKGGSLQSMTTKEIKQNSKRIFIDLTEDHKKISESKSKSGIGKFETKNIDKNCIRMNVLLGRIAAKKGSFYDLAREISSSEAPLQVLEDWENRFGSDQPLAGIKVAIEGANTPSGKLAEEIFSKLGAKTILINGEVKEVEGEHKADPSNEDNLKMLKETIEKEDADCGLAFDLDGDRGAMVVPEKFRTSPGVRFRSLAPDNLLAVLLPYLIKDLGYDPKITGKKIGTIRDVTGTFAVNDKALKLGVEAFQTDAGYVFLKALREKLLRQNMIMPIYGERSGHCWLDVTGEIENPIAIAVLLASLVKKTQYQGNQTKSLMPFAKTYQENSDPYSASPRFQPPFHPKLLAKLSLDPRNDTGWKYNPDKPTNPPQLVIGLGKDAGIKALQSEFTLGKIFNTPAGNLKVKKINTSQDAPEDGGLFRFADIIFELDGEFAGRFVFRASSNDPTFVCSYETPVKENGKENLDIAKKRRVSMGGLILNWLEKNGYALITQEEMKTQLKINDLEAQDKSKKLNLDFPADDLNSYRLAVSSPMQNVKSQEEILKSWVGLSSDQIIENLCGAISKGNLSWESLKNHQESLLKLIAQEERVGSSEFAGKLLNKLITLQNTLYGEGKNDQGHAAYEIVHFLTNSTIVDIEKNEEGATIVKFWRERNIVKEKFVLDGDAYNYLIDKIIKRASSALEEEVLLQELFVKAKLKTGKNEVYTLSQIAKNYGGSITLGMKEWFEQMLNATDSDIRKMASEVLEALKNPLNKSQVPIYFLISTDELFKIAQNQNKEAFDWLVYKINQNPNIMNTEMKTWFESLVNVSGDDIRKKARGVLQSTEAKVSSSITTSTEVNSQEFDKVLNRAKVILKDEINSMEKLYGRRGRGDLGLNYDLSQLGKLYEALLSDAIKEFSNVPGTVSLVSFYKALQLEYKQGGNGDFQILSQQWRDLGFADLFNISSLHDIEALLNKNSSSAMVAPVGGIDLASMKLEIEKARSLPEAQKVSSAIELQSLYAAYALSGLKWDGLAGLYFYQIMLMIKDGIAKDLSLEARNRLIMVGERLKLNGYLGDNQSLNFFNQLKLNMSLGQMKVSLP